MNYGAPTKTHNRKRSSAWLEQDESENVSLAYTPVNLSDMPAKRLQNSQGAAVQAKPLLKYDAQKLLLNLSFTRCFVTANYNVEDCSLHGLGAE